MKILRVLPVLFLSIITFTSCEKDSWLCTEGNGFKTERNVNHAYFSGVYLDFNAEVYVRQGNTSSSRIVASENIINDIDAYVSNGDLVLILRNDRCVNEMNGRVKIYVTSPNYESFTVNGSGDIQNESYLDLNDLDVTVDGRGCVLLSNIAVDDYTIDIDGSGDVELRGASADNGNVVIDGSGDVDVDELLTNSLRVEINGSGDARVNVVNTLNAVIIGSGDVRYSGTPTVTSMIQGSGNVIKD